MNIKTIAAISTAAILSMVAVMTLLLLGPANASAHNTGTPHEETASTAGKAAAGYNYVAQPGDSYSKMARKAIQTYGIKNKVNLTNSQIMFAETNLTQQAGSPYLNSGQAVNLTDATVKGWVDKAKALSPQAAAKWDKYVVGVNFNTNNVGEVRK